MLKIEVTVRDERNMLVTQYVMDHDDQSERRRLGEECRRAFEQMQSVNTRPLGRSTK